MVPGSPSPCRDLLTEGWGRGCVYTFPVLVCFFQLEAADSDEEMKLQQHGAWPPPQWKTPTTTDLNTQDIGDIFCRCIPLISSVLAVWRSGGSSV